MNAKRRYPTDLTDKQWEKLEPLLPQRTNQGRPPKYTYREIVNGMLYVLRGTEQNGESWTIARVDLREETPVVTDLATVPFACRSLAFDGETFWTNHRAAGEVVSFSVPQ